MSKKVSALSQIFFKSLNIIGKISQYYLNILSQSSSDHSQSITAKRPTQRRGRRDVITNDYKSISRYSLSYVLVKSLPVQFPRSQTIITTEIQVIN